MSRKHGRSRTVRAILFSFCLLGLLVTASPPAVSAANGFENWLSGLRTEALSRGIKPNILDQALTGLTPIPRVVELDRKQPEFTQTLERYLSRVVSTARIKKGRKKLFENQQLLEQIEQKYGVPAQFLVALWGIETDFGRLTGGFKVIRALATLAYDGRRAAYFRKELFAALTILDQGHIRATDMTGSWAGAMGQNQFMPSSFLSYAVDHDGDGKRNIWTSRADIFASSANYLARVGWKRGLAWGRKVRLPDDFSSARAGLEKSAPIAEWQTIGVRRSDGTDLPKHKISGSIILPEGAGGDAYLVYDNYRAIMRWNRAHFFAIAVGSLADAIRPR